MGEQARTTSTTARVRARIAERITEQVGRLATEAGDDLDIDLSQLPPPPTVVSVLQQFGRRFSTDAVVPVVLFLVLNTAAGLAWAMVASSVWAIVLIIVRRRAGKAAGPLVWFSLGYVLLRGTAGIVTGSDAVFFGPGIASNFVVAGLFVGSVIARRPAVGYIALIFYPFPPQVRNHDAYRRVFSRLSLAWAALETFTGALQVLLLATTTTNTYLVVRSVVAWPLSVALFVVSLRYPRRVFASEPDLAAWVEAAEAGRGPDSDLVVDHAGAVPVTEGSVE
jgi:intracellular septation protein A